MNNRLKDKIYPARIFYLFIFFLLIILVFVFRNHHLLVYAVRRSNNPLAKISITINKKNLYSYDYGRGFTPLHVAAEKGNLELVRFILNKGVDVDQRSEKINEVKFNSYSTPLHLAVLEKQKEVVFYLISKKANSNSGDHMGYTPLHFAVANGDEEIIMLLIKNGADVNAKNIYGKSPINMTIDPKIEKILFDNGAAKQLKQPLAEKNIQPKTPKKMRN